MPKRGILAVRRIFVVCFSLLYVTTLMSKRKRIAKVKQYVHTLKIYKKVGSAVCNTFSLLSVKFFITLQ